MELADIRARLRERRQAAWGEGGEGRRSGQIGVKKCSSGEGGAVPIDLGEKLADLLRYLLAILLGHESTCFVCHGLSL